PQGLGGQRPAAPGGPARHRRVESAVPDVPFPCPLSRGETTMAQGSGIARTRVAAVAACAALAAAALLFSPTGATPPGGKEAGIKAKTPAGSRSLVMAMRVPQDMTEQELVASLRVAKSYNKGKDGMTFNWADTKLKQISRDIYDELADLIVTG